MLDDELAEIIAGLRSLGTDDADVEAKRADDKLPRSVRETLSAFTNARGGVLILGLDEAAGFNVSGVHDPAKMTADLGALCSEDMEPPLRPAIRTHRIEGADLVVAEIPSLEQSRKPCYYRGAGMAQGSYIRVADGDRRLNSYEVQLMVSNRGQPTDDESIVADASIDNLDSRLAREFVGRLRTHRPYAFDDLGFEEALHRAKVLADGHVTVAGLLTLGAHPQAYFPQLIVSFVHYPTTDGANLDSGERFLDNVALEGPIPVIVRDTMTVLRRNMSRRATIHGSGRVDTWEYPETAIREAVVNALAHRDYSPQARGAQVQIEMYPDRLLIRNPGGLFGPVTEDNLGEEGVSSARNATLLRILEDSPIPGSDRTVCENRGSGIHTMLKSLRDAALSPPEFVDKISLFRVTFPNHTLIGADVVEWIRSLGEQGLTDSQCHGLAILKNGDVLNNRSYRSASGLDSRRATAELSDLVARGLLTQSGGRRWASYELASGLAGTDAVTSTRFPQSAARGNRRQQILTVIGSGELSRAEIANATGLSSKAVSRWLRILRNEGAVELANGSARSPHVRYRRIDTGADNPS